MQQTDTITLLRGLADHARLSRAHWLRSARHGASGSHGPAYCIEGAVNWRRLPGELLAQIGAGERTR